MKSKKASSRNVKGERVRRYKDFHTRIPEIIQEEQIDYIKENRGIKRGSRRITRAFFGMINREKIISSKARSARALKNNRRQISNTQKVIKPRKGKRRGLKERLVLIAGGLTHWLKQGAIHTRKHSISRLALFSCAFIVIIAGGSAAFAKAIKNDQISLPSFIAEKPVELTVIVVYGEVELEFKSFQKTVGELLQEHEITVGKDDILRPDEDTLITDNMHIIIDRSFIVILNNRSKKVEVITTSGKVGDVLSGAGIKPDDDDEVIPDIDEKLIPNMEIIYNEVELKRLIETLPIEYTTVTGTTKTVEKGYYHLEQKGKDGVRQITTQIRYVNGEEESRKIVLDEVIEEPINEIKLYGLADKPKATESDDGHVDTVPVGGTTVVINNPGAQATNPSVPDPPSSYLSTMSGHLTAYTHTGSQTATGTWPRSTRTLDNPGSCAVVPATIPYGTLIYVTGYGYCIAEDTGGFRHDPDRWNQIDVFMNTYAECTTFGRRDDVVVYILS